MRPIQEQQPASKVAENRHGIRQLQRRPAPAGYQPPEIAYGVESGFSIGAAWSQFVLASDVQGAEFDVDTPTFAMDSGDILVGKGGVYQLVFWIQPDSTSGGVVTETNFEVRHEGGAAWTTLTGDAQAFTVTSHYDGPSEPPGFWDVPPVVVPFYIQQGSVDLDGPAVLRFSALIEEDGAAVTRDCSIRYWFYRFGPLYTGA